LAESARRDDESYTCLERFADERAHSRVAAFERDERAGV